MEFYLPRQSQLAEKKNGGLLYIDGSSRVLSAYCVPAIVPNTFWLFPLSVLMASTVLEPRPDGGTKAQRSSVSCPLDNLSNMVTPDMKVEEKILEKANEDKLSSIRTMKFK